MQTSRQIVRSGKVDRQIFELEFAEIDACGGVDRQLQSSGSTGRRRDALLCQCRCTAIVARLGNLERPDGQIARGREFTVRRSIAPDVSEQSRAARQPETRYQAGLVGIWLELGDSHRRRGSQVMRVDDFEQMLGKTRKLFVDLELNASRHEREALQKTLDVGVRTFQPLQSEASGDLREIPCELTAHLANVLKFTVVIFEQPWIHGHALLIRVADRNVPAFQVDLRLEDQ